MESAIAYVLSKKGFPPLAFTIRQCIKAELEDILALQDIVCDTISSKETFVYSTERELDESLEADVCLGAYYNGTLAAFTLMVTNPASLRNLGLYLGYNPEQLSKCVTYDTTFVHPDYTGYGLQRLFVTLKDSMARELGALEALATVAPGNTVSLGNLQTSGFVIAEEKRMYGELNRYIMRKHLFDTSGT